jgi:hypothetical protein
VLQVSDSIDAHAWARLWPSVRPPHSRNLRAGAWYAVLNDEMADRVTILLYGDEVDVPRRVLEVRDRRPTRFSVVHRVGYRRAPGRASMFHLGKRYAVCPACSWRFGLVGEPERRQCPNCGHEGEVAWWETA